MSLKIFLLDLKKLVENSQENFEIHNFVNMINVSNKLKGLSFIVKNILIYRALSNSHHIFHRKYGRVSNKFKGTKKTNLIYCFPCIMKLNEFFRLTSNCGFNNIEHYIQYLEHGRRKKYDKTSQKG